MNLDKNKINYKDVYRDKFNGVNTFLTEVARDINTFVPIKYHNSESQKE